MVCISMPSPMYIIEPASATTLSAGSSSISTNCISEPWISKSTSSARLRRACPGGGGGGVWALRTGTVLAGAHSVTPWQ